MTHHWEMVKLSFKSSQVLQVLLKKLYYPMLTINYFKFCALFKLLTLDIRI